MPRSSEPIDRFLAMTQELREELSSSLRTYPNDDSVRLPFHSAYRPSPGQRPTTAQRAVIDWRDSLAKRNDALRTHFMITSRSHVLTLMPLSGYGTQTNFGYNISAEQALGFLSREAGILEQENEHLEGCDRRNSPDALANSSQPSLPSARAIELLSQQVERAKTIRKLAAGDPEIKKWENTVENILNAIFGTPRGTQHRNTQEFVSCHQTPFSPRHPKPARQLQSEHQVRTDRRNALLEGFIEQIELLAPPIGQTHPNDSHATQSRTKGPEEIMSEPLPHTASDLILKVKMLEPNVKSGATTLVGQADRIITACETIVQSWSGSYLGYHSELYYGDFERPPLNARFSPEWGGLKGLPPGWNIREYQDVKMRIEELAAAQLDPLETATAELLRPLQALQGDIIIELSPLHSLTSHARERELLTSLEAFAWGTSRGECIHANIPKSFSTRDSGAMSAGASVPAHLFYEAVAVECRSRCLAAQEFLTLSQRILRPLLAFSQIQPSAASVVRDRIFIGHGRSHAWRQLKDFLADRLHLRCDEFNEESAAGMATVARLVQMLDHAQFAFLVMTGEDRHADETAHARENVIHEAGLFQGCLGFERAIILLEEGCADFSNIHGLTSIRFPKGNLEPTFEKVRQVLERERVI